MVLAQQGQPEAYENFLREVSVVLRAFLTSRTKSLAELEDTLQDTLLTLHRGRHSYTPGRPIGPWIYAICENRIIDRVRQRLRIEKIEQAWKSAHQDLAAEVNGRDNQTEYVLELMERLPAKQKWIILLLKFQGLSVTEVALQTGMSESAVKVTAFRGYEAIRKFFKGSEK